MDITWIIIKSKNKVLYIQPGRKKWENVFCYTQEYIKVQHDNVYTPSPWNNTNMHNNVSFTNASIWYFTFIDSYVCRQVVGVIWECNSPAS